MTATIAICTWNRSEALAVTLDHLTRLRIPAGVEWELLVVNNNCTDDTDEVCRRFEGRLPLRLLHETRPGKSFALNLAISESRGTYILWTDDDVIIDPEWMAILLAAFEREHADWVFGTSEPEFPGPRPSWYDARFRGYFAALDYGPNPFVVTDPEQSFYGLNCAGTRGAHVALGGFRSEFGPRGVGGGVGEDTDIFRRSLQARMKIVYEPRARVRHMIAPARLTKQFHRHRQWLANRVVYQYLNERYPGVVWSFGMPRFFYAYGAKEAARYLKCLVTRNTSERFAHELEFLKVFRFFLESGRSGFRNPRRPAAGGKIAARSEGVGR
jgi:glycosyltransferase involved in cell wall biosynthesis